MQNEKRTNTTPVDTHNPQKQGESSAINKLNETDNEDPSANPNRQPATAQQGQNAQNQIRSGPQQGDIGNKSADQNQNRPAQQSDQNRRPYDPNMQSGSVNQGQNAPPRVGQQSGSDNQGQNTLNQNRPGEEMHESEDETAPENRMSDADTRQGNQQQQNAQNLPRSRRQLGDPDDEVSAETRRKESLAELAEKAEEGTPDISSAAKKPTTDK